MGIDGVAIPGRGLIGTGGITLVKPAISKDSSGVGSLNFKFRPKLKNWSNLIDQQWLKTPAT